MDQKRPTWIEDENSALPEIGSVSTQQKLQITTANRKRYRHYELRVNLLSPEKLKTLYSLVDASADIDGDEKMNEHHNASDVCWYFRSADININSKLDSVMLSASTTARVIAVSLNYLLEILTTYTANYRENPQKYPKLCSNVDVFRTCHDQNSICDQAPPDPRWKSLQVSPTGGQGLAAPSSRISHLLSALGLKLPLLTPVSGYAYVFKPNGHSNITLFLYQ